MSLEENFDNLQIVFDYLCKNEHLKTAEDLVMNYLDNCSSLSMAEKLENVKKLHQPHSVSLSTLWVRYQSNKANFSDAIVIDYLESCKFFDLSKKLKKKRLGKIPPLNGVNLKKLWINFKMSKSIKTQQSMDFLNICGIPDVANIIFENLDDCSLANCRLVNKSWNNFVSDLDYYRIRVTYFPKHWNYVQK